MTRRITEIDEATGRVCTGRRPRSASLIPWTPGPTTRIAKIRRALIG